MTRGLGLLRALAAACLIALAAPSAFGRHPPVDALAAVRVNDSGELTVELTHDAVAFALNDTSANIPDAPMFELLDGPDEVLGKRLEEARARFAKLCVLEADGARVPIEVTAGPTVAAVREHQARRRGSPLPVKLQLIARAGLPAGARAFHIRFPEMLGKLLLTVERPGEEIVALPLEANEVSPDFAIPRPSTSEAPAPPQADAEHAGSIFRRFVILGFHHIIPEGADHCLFVLGLFLLKPRFKPVLVQISAFTLAHTLTLTLSSLGLVGVPSRLVEPAIAASIAFVGIENVLTRKVDWKRSVVAFAFGLVHGLGVASTFNEGGFPPGKLVPSLAAFTVGVEGGHITVLAAAFLCLGWFRAKPWYRSRVAIPISVLISLVALYWFVTRVWSLDGFMR